jgi:hypothetical protein
MGGIMYRKLPSEGKVLGYHLSGSISGSELREIRRELEGVIAEHGRARVLLEVGEIPILQPAAIIEDLRLAPDFLLDVERLAIVADGRWASWIAQLNNFISRGEARHFTGAQLEDAWTWLREGLPATA